MGYVAIWALWDIWALWGNEKVHDMGLYGLGYISVRPLSRGQMLAQLERTSTPLVRSGHQVYFSPAALLRRLRVSRVRRRGKASSSERARVPLLVCLEKLVNGVTVKLPKYTLIIWLERATSRRSIFAKSQGCDQGTRMRHAA
jgi:hypothetical protein